MRVLFEISAFSVDLAAALGTGDDDLALTARHTAHRAAVGAGEILVLPVLNGGKLPLQRPPDQLQELGIFRAALGQILGEHTEDHPHRQHGGQRMEDHIYQIVLDKDFDGVQRQRRQDHRHTQLIRAVSSVHKAHQRIANSTQETHTKASLLQDVRKILRSFYDKIS